MKRSATRLVASWAAVGAMSAVLLVGVTAAPALAAPPASAEQDSAATDESDSSSAQDEADAEAAAVARARAAATARRAANAERRAAEAAQRGRAAWESHGRPNKMVIVRPGSVDSLTNGELSRRAPRAAGPLTAAGLDAAVPGEWVTVTNGTVRLAAAVVLSSGASLDLGGGGVTTVQLVGGATAADAAAVYTGGGQLTVHDVTVTSIDPASGQPVAPGPGRPFVYVASNGRLDARDATFRGLGTPATDPSDQAGITFSVASTGSLVRTTVQGASTGVRLKGSTGVRLEGLTIAESADDGLLLQGDQGTALSGVRAERNGGNGVEVRGPSSNRPITGITTTGNGRFGLAVVSQDAPQITNIVTQADKTGGLQLSGDNAPAVSGFTAVDQPIGVLTHISSNKVTLSGLRISGGGRGIVVEKTTDGLTLSGSTIDGAETGVSVGGKNTELRDILVHDSQSGIRVERGAIGVAATALTVSGGQDGVVLVPGTSDVVLRDMVIDGVANSGVRTSSPQAQIQGGRISNSATGIDAEAATAITGTEITAVNVGIRARSSDLVAADNVSVSAMSSGINVQDGSPFVLTDSRVDALEAVRGQADYQGLNTLSLPPLNVLGVIGIPLVLLALLLDQVQRFRQRRRGGFDRRRLPPAPRVQAGAH